MESIISLFKAEPFKKEFTIGGVRFELRMLTRNEYDDVMSRTKMASDDVLSREAILKRPVLGYSLQSINGVNIKDVKEIKEKIDKSNGFLPINLAVEDVLGGFDAFFIDTLYNFHLKLIEEDEKNKESLKKD